MKRTAGVGRTKLSSQVSMATGIGTRGATAAQQAAMASSPQPAPRSLETCDPTQLTQANTSPWIPPQRFSSSGAHAAGPRAARHATAPSNGAGAVNGAREIGQIYVICVFRFSHIFF
jgi:hypothetical protein